MYVVCMLSIYLYIYISIHHPSTDLSIHPSIHHPSIHPSIFIAPLDSMLRSLVLGQYCSYGNKEAIEEAQHRFLSHCDKSSLVSADLKGVVFSTAMKNGDETTYTQLIKVYIINGCGLLIPRPLLFSFMMILIIVMNGLVYIVLLVMEVLRSL